MPFEDELDDDARAERFHELYEDILGECDAVFHVPQEEVKPGRAHIDVLVWYLRDGRDHLLVTTGASTFEQGSKEHPTHRPRVELYAKLPGALDGPRLTEVSRALWRLAHWPFGAFPRRFLAEWHFYYGFPPLTDGSALDAWVLTMPFVSHGELSKLGTKLGAQFLQAYGITEGEGRRAENLRGRDILMFVSALMRIAGTSTDPRRTEVHLPALPVSQPPPAVQ
jgi:Suppressor of fused protein (SUFU)